MRDFFKRLFGQHDSAAHERAGAGQRMSEKHFDELVAGVRDYAIFLLDAQGNVQTWNAGAERIKGYVGGEIVGKHFSIFYTKEAIASGWPDQALEHARAAGRFEDEGWRLRKDGTQFWANVVITALRDAGGGVRGFLKITRDLSERRQAEENARRLTEEEGARRAAEVSAREERRHREQLHVTLRSIGDAVIVSDMKGAVTFMNPVAQELTGWTPQDAAGKALDEVFHIVNEETRQEVENPVTKVLREGVTVGLANHTVLIAKGGREVPIDDSGAPIRGEDGTIAGVVLVFRDVTEARRAVEARLHLAAIVESSEDAIISKTLDGGIVSWNKAAEHLYGYTAEEAVGRPLAMLVPPDHPDELPSLMERLRRGERVERFETIRMRKDGSRVDVSLTISPIRNAEGKVIGASKITRDITAVKRQQMRLRFLADASQVLAAVLDVQSTLQRVAGLAVPGFADWCAVDMLQPDGELCRVAVAHVDPAKIDLARGVRPVRDAQGGPWHVVRSGRAELVAEITDDLLAASIKDPEQLALIRYLDLRSYIGVPLRERGKTLGAISFIAAESGRRYDAEDLHFAEELVHRAATAIENARLYAQLKEADRRKDEFLAMLSHELRNPLAPIRNGLHLMGIPGVGPEKITKARAMTERQVQHLVRLVDDLLDVSRIMRGRIELRKEPVELTDIIATAVETVQSVLDAQGQQLILTEPEEPIQLHADPARLTQVIGNLLNNAAKFSEHAGRVWLAAERRGHEVVVSIRDEGLGIAPEVLPNVFDLFVQGDKSLERLRGGLGIGLTVVRRLVELHGGSVAARSEGTNRGSEFIVRLPLGIPPSQGPAPSKNGDPPAAAVHRRVLIVDDNMDAAETLGVLVRLWGHEVRIAFTGPEALKAAAELRPEIIILDIGLPEINGYDVARRLRERPEFAKTTLIALTGYGQEDDRRRSIEAGFDHHVTKPVLPEALRRLLAAPLRT
jgi:PAS domain S-box-containing protein